MDKAEMIGRKREAIQNAYQGLPTAVRTDVDYHAAILDTRMEERNPRVKFSHTMAVEVLGAVGLFIEARRAAL